MYDIGICNYSTLAVYTYSTSGDIGVFTYVLILLQQTLVFTTSADIAEFTRVPLVFTNSYSNALRALKDRSKKSASQFGPKSRQFVNPKQVFK